MPKPKQPTTWREWRIMDIDYKIDSNAFMTKNDAESWAYSGDRVICVEWRCREIDLGRGYRHSRDAKAKLEAICK